MKRAKATALTAIAAALLALVLGAALLALRGPEVPVLKVSRQPFQVRVRADGVLKAIDSTPVSTPISAGASMTIAWIVDDGTFVRKGDLIARFDPTDFEKGLRDGQADEAMAKDKIAKAKAQSQSVNVGLDLDASMAKRDMAHAKAFQTKDEHIFSRFEIATSLMDTELAQSRADYAQEMKKAKGTLARTEIDLYAIEAQKADRDVKRAEASYNACEVRAPHDGVVILQRDWRQELPRPGKVVWPGQKLAEIPKPGGLQAEVYVLEADAGGLAVGQRAEAEPFGYYGAPVAAVVSMVDTLARPRFPSVPVQYFGATLKFVGKVPDSLVPGQRIQAVILIADLKDVLVVPRQAVFQRDGHAVVYKKWIMGSFKPVPVTLGQGAPGRVVVKEGLEASDVVALVDPATAKAADAEASNRAGPSVGGAP
jgi:multidrug resistance efflux pump